MNNLEWLNENELRAFPLSKSIKFDDLIVDASFVQFDNFVPVLQTITVSPESIDLQVLLQTGVIQIHVPSTGFVPNTVFAFPGGKVVIGKGAYRVWQEALGQILVINTTFSESVVTSINSQAGVWSIASESGDVELIPGTYIKLGSDTDTVTFNAFNTASNIPFLKTVNSVLPTDNGLRIDDSELIRVSTSPSTVQLNLVGLNTSALLNKIYPINNSQHQP